MNLVDLVMPIHRWLSEHPPQMREEEADVYAVTNYSLVAALLSHVAFIFIFWALHLTLLTWFNVGSVCLFMFSLRLSKAGRLNPSLLLGISEVMAHAWVATIYTGWNTGFHFPIVLSVVIIYFFTGIPMYWRMTVGALQITAYITLALYASLHAPLVVLDPNVVRALSAMCIFILMSVTMGICYYYTYAVKVARHRMKQAQERTFELEVRERTRAAEHAQHAAEAASEAKSAFLANMSHEVRTPLNAIINLTSLAADVNSAPQVADYLRKIQTCSRSLLAIINDVLDLSRIESGKMKVETTDFDLRDIVQSLGDLVGDEARRRGIDFETTISAGVPCLLRGDPLRLGQVLTNLVYNAMKFTEQGHIRVDVECLRPTPKARLRFAVTDTGIGIPAEALGRVFESFTQVDESTARKYGGTGLGLPICKHLVELMGGAIEAASTPGKGSTFSFTLELEPQPDADQTAAPAPRTADNKPRSNLRSARVLVVEDVEINQQITREILQRAGVFVEVAGDGQEAIRRIAEQAFDAVLMDVQMPGMDGFEATRRIRRDERFRDLPIIATTAHAMLEDKERCLAAGMNGYVTKPIDTQTLLATLAAHVRREAPPEPDLPIIDREDALQQFGGNSEKLMKLLGMFAKGYGDTVDKVREAAEGGDTREARRLLHTLVGVAGNLRLSRPYAVTQEVQVAVRAEDRAAYGALLLRLEAALREVLAEIATLQMPGTATSPLEPTPSGGCLLVVDDDALNRQMLRQALEAKGHRIIEAGGGKEAFTVLAQEAVDTILLDVVMPGMSGFEVCRKLKSDAATRAIPVLMVTALEDRADRLEGIAAGAEDFIHKPLDVAELTLRVSNALRSKRIHDELVANYARLKQLEQLRDTLTQMLVHDLKAPLTGLIGYTYVLDDSASPRLNDDEKSCLQQVRAISGSLLEMVSAILDVSRLEADSMPLTLEDVELQPLVGEAIESLGAIEDHTIARDGNAEVTLHCDRSLMRRVLANLLSNALHYAPPGSTIRLVTSRQGREVEVRVIDRGRGIPAAQRDRIFEKFAQVDGSDARPRHSSGLGLTFCKLVVEKHGGRIGVDSVEGEGSEFWVRLALQDKAESEPATVGAQFAKSENSTLFEPRKP
jgi:signal transduction histidine kinase/HPt (histidine-containing phosphotransfer) domain-containing protein